MYTRNIFFFFRYCDPRSAVFGDKRGLRIITRFTTGVQGRISNFVGFRGNRWQKYYIYTYIHNIIYYNRNGKYAAACTEYDYYNTYYTAAAPVLWRLNTYNLYIRICTTHVHPFARRRQWGKGKKVTAVYNKSPKGRKFDKINEIGPFDYAVFPKTGRSMRF